MVRRRAVGPVSLVYFEFVATSRLELFFSSSSSSSFPHSSSSSFPSTASLSPSSLVHVIFSLRRFFFFSSFYRETLFFYLDAYFSEGKMQQRRIGRCAITLEVIHSLPYLLRHKCRTTAHRAVSRLATLFSLYDK